jgi:hypothetical protein
MAFGDPDQRFDASLEDAIPNDGEAGIRRTRGIKTAGRMRKWRNILLIKVDEKHR